MIVREAIWKHYCSNDSSQTIRKQPKKTTKIYVDIACDLCCYCPCCCFVSLVCSDWLPERLLESSHAFEPHFKRLVNTYQCNNNQIKEDKLIISLYLCWRNACCCHPMMIHCCIFHWVTVVSNHSCLLPTQRPGILERIVFGSLTCA